jgi:DNA repair protein RadC
MKFLANDDRPREKLQRHGVAALGDNELLALVIGSGSRRGGALTVANEVLAAHGGVHALARCSADGLARTKGIGRARAAQIVAAIELGRRTLATAAAERPRVTSARDAAQLLLPRFGSHGVEQFGIILLDTRHRVLRTAVIASGTTNTSVVEPREVFREAALGGASAIVAFTATLRRSTPRTIWR